MKLILSSIFALLSLNAAAQVIRTEPVFFKETEGVRIIFDATLGNSGLAGYTGNVFVHTGVVTNLGTGWNHVITGWNQNIPARNQATRLAPDLYEFVIMPNIREFYGVTNPNENIEQIAILFRNANGSRVGRADGGGDMFIDLLLEDFAMRVTSPQPGQFIDPTDNVDFTVVASSNANITFFLNGTEFASATDVTEFTYSYNNFVTDQYQFVARVESLTYATIIYDTLNLNIRTPRTYEPVPDGARDGINRNFPNAGDVTFVLRVPKRTSPQPTWQNPNIPQTYELGRESVHIIGDFNNWQPSSAYQLKACTTRLSYWITLSGLDVERLYRFQYLVDETQRITDPYTELILDPWNDQWINHHSRQQSPPFDIYPDMPEFPVGLTTGLVATFQIDRPEFQWSPEALAFVRPVQQDLIIYELLIRDFMEFPSYDRIMEHKWQHFVDLGINAIKIMPNMEFDGNDSWGYNPNHMFAVDKAYGTRESFKRFIDKAHSHGIAIILDIVLNHQTGSSPLTQLFWDSQNNRPCADHNPWFHPVATHPWNVFYQMNQRSEHTVYFSRRVAEFWMEEFRVDGFRFDLSKAFTFLGPSEQYAMDRPNPTRIQYWQDFADFMWDIDPTFYVILEHFAHNPEERDLANHGLSDGRPGMMLWGNMNWQFSQLAGSHASNSSLDWAFAKEGRRNAAGNFTGNRGWDAHNLIVYAESHDEERVSTRVGGFTNVGGQFVHAGYGRISADGTYNTRYLQAQRKALVASFLIPLPGPTMIWQFGEFAFDGPLNICYSPTNLGGSGVGTFPGNQSGLGGGAGQCRTGRSPLLWHYLDRATHMATFRIFSTLINMRLNHPAFQNQRNFFYQTGGGATDLRRWIIAESHVADSSVVIIGNFDVIPRDFVIPNIPADGRWYNFFGENQFGIDYLVATNGTITATLPPGANLILTKEWRDNTSVAGFDRTEIPMIVHPNPAQDEIFVEFATEGQREIIIHTLNGQMIHTLITRDKHTRIDVSHVRAGLYILSVSDGTSISSQQIIIQ